MDRIKIDKIIRTKRKSVSLIINSDSTLTVRAPLFVSNNSIKKLVSKKSRWVKNKQKEAKKRLRQNKPKKYINGENFLYLGKKYKLYVVASAKKPLIFRQRFYLDKNSLADAKNLFIQWYKNQALKILLTRVDHYSSISRIRYKKIKISSAQKRLGSCSSKNNLNFSWRLIMAPVEIIDYIVIHELAHIKEKNHSKKFWRRVAILVPDFKHSEIWLKKNIYSLTL